MQKLVNFARGWVRAEVRGPFPERAINLCARNGVRFWAAERVDEEAMRVTVLRRDAARARELAGRAGCDFRAEGRTGLPFFLRRFRRRYAFLAGLVLSVAAVAVLSGFVLTVEVTGNERVPDAAILAQLRREGLRPGVYGPSLDTRQIEWGARLAMEELAWISINLYGTRAQVVVRETVPPPPMVEQEGVSDLVARAGGLILSVDAVQGQAVVAPGDTVAPGETLISGTVILSGPEYSDIAPSRLCVRAAGSVRARTWRQEEAVTPLTAVGKRYVGRKRTRWSLTVFDRRVNFYANGSIPWEKYDKISTTYPVVLPGDQRLPLFLTREELLGWEPEPVAIRADGAEELLRARLLERLEQAVGPDGRVLDVDWNARIDGGLLTVTAREECEEEIGVSTPVQMTTGD